jgi:dTDP-4-dehydrorhamnose 3,5-epimerase
MDFKPTSLPDVLLVTPRRFGDERGWFAETWQARRFAAGGIDTAFVQDNQSHSRQWVLRGLHYQIRQPQGKLVRVTRGEIFDVAVDLRRASPTFGAWVGAVLSADNGRMLWIPAGFAHGFLALSDDADVAYKATDYYAPEHERSVIWNDSTIGIQWPLPQGVEPMIGKKDATASTLAAAELFD